MRFKVPFLVIIILMAGLVLTTNGEPDMKANSLKKQKSWNIKVMKIMTSEKYLGNRSNAIAKLIGYGAIFTTENVSSALDAWLRSAQRRDGDLSLIHFTPDMLTESNKDKFNNAIQGINRKEVIDKLKALELVINNASEIDSSVFNRLINSKYNIFHKSDMSIHWLEYFLSSDKIDINYYLEKSLMRTAIQENNFSVADLLIKNYYKVTELDFESLRNYTTDVLEDEEGTVDKEKALEALSKIENLLMDNIKNNPQ